MSAIATTTETTNETLQDYRRAALANADFHDFRIETDRAHVTIVYVEKQYEWEFRWAYRISDEFLREAESCYCIRGEITNCLLTAILLDLTNEMPRALRKTGILSFFGDGRRAIADAILTALTKYLR